MFLQVILPLFLDVLRSFVDLVLRVLSFMFIEFGTLLHLLSPLHHFVIVDQLGLQVDAVYVVVSLLGLLRLGGPD